MAYRGVPKPQPVAQVSEKQQRIAFYAQKREAFFMSALNALLSNPKVYEKNTRQDDDDLIKEALAIADKSFKALYLAKEEQCSTSE